MIRDDREDLTAQRVRVHENAHALTVALENAEKVARSARRVTRGGRGVDLDDFYAAVAQVRRCEEALDMAELDLRTAAGDDA